MKIIKLNQNKLEKIIQEVKIVLKNKGIIIYPTDTLYGVGALVKSKLGVEKIHRFKKSDPSKPMSLIVPSLDWIFERMENLDEECKDFILERLPGAYTFIVKIKPKFQNEFKSVIQNGNLGFRYPNNLFCQKLGQSLQKAFVTTSVNLSGQEPIYSLDEFKQKFVRVDKNLWPDLFIDVGELPKKSASRIIDLTVYPFKVIR